MGIGTDVVLCGAFLYYELNIIDTLAVLLFYHLHAVCGSIFLYCDLLHILIKIFMKKNSKLLFL